MPIDPTIINREFTSYQYSYSFKDVILYALGVGSGNEPEELQFVFEDGLRMLPTFCTIPSNRAFTFIQKTREVEVPLSMILHAEHYLEIYRHSIPLQANLMCRAYVTKLLDKGKNALLYIDVITENDMGERLFINRWGLFMRGEGGFGGERGNTAGNEPPGRAPDAVTTMETLPQQALLYRLSGDYNPLHASPAFAAAAGLDKPILHGLCTFGFAARAVLSVFAGNDPCRFKSMKARFAKPVIPGQKLLTEMWKVKDGEIILRCKVVHGEEYCLTNAVVFLNEESI